MRQVQGLGWGGTPETSAVTLSQCSRHTSFIPVCFKGLSSSRRLEALWAVPPAPSTLLSAPLGPAHAHPPDGVLHASLRESLEHGRPCGSELGSGNPPPWNSAWGAASPPEKEAGWWNGSILPPSSHGKGAVHCCCYGTTTEVPGLVSPELTLREEAPLSQSSPSSGPPPTCSTVLLQLDEARRPVSISLTVTQA